ncbi:MAG TPA: glycosyltransferase family 2 protein [Polyangiaceae bacterium]|nr:glycosyltransferase family 2 protein [Polyangiaceae bacterium]
MLLRVLQQIVRAVPGPTKAIWDRVPEPIRRAVSPIIFPIAVGSRTRGRPLPVPEPAAGALFDVVVEADEAVAGGAIRVLAERGHRVLRAPADAPLHELFRREAVSDAVWVTTARTAAARLRDGRLLGARILPESELGAPADAAAAFPEVSIVVVTYASRETCRACLASIRRNTAFPGLEVLVVDNASSDGTAQVLAEASARDARIRVLRSDENLGFARGSNWGLREARGEIVVLLNDDTVVAPGWLSRLVAHLEADPSIAIVCPVTNEAASDARVESAYETLEEMEAFARRRAAEWLGRRRTTEAVNLFCAAGRAGTFRELGYLDERYEVGMFEDDDLSLSARRRGLSLAVAEDAFVHHVGQGSFGKLSDSEYLRIWEANRRRFEEKWGVAWKPPRG